MRDDRGTMTTPPSTFDSALRAALSAGGAVPDGADGAAVTSAVTSADETARPARARRPRADRRSFPVTVTQLPTVRCQVCGGTVAHRRGEVGAALTTHYEREHPELLGG